MDIKATIQQGNDEFDEFTIAKPWELDKDKFFVDASPEEIWNWHKKQQQKLAEAIIKEFEGEVAGNQWIGFTKDSAEGIWNKALEIINDKCKKLRESL